jgi:hypothetical protein
MTKRHALAFSAVALLLPPVLLAVGALVLIPLVIIAVMAMPFVGPAMLAGMFAFADRTGQLESPGDPPASLINGLLA